MASSETPPGTSSHSTAWRRQATWVRVLDRLRWRRDHSLASRRRGPPRHLPWGSSTGARRWPPTARRGDRSCWSTRWRAAAPSPPAWAGRPGPARRQRPAAGRGGSPGPWRSRPPRCATETQPPHFRRRSSCLGPDCTRSSARLRSPLSTATAVCDPL
jgi:hypothetical protein